ncbi:DUF2225 domain-containing protein [Bacillus tianshenii]|nr:DUF2225 domain-containing protein [Bacillus tianshenii]
MVLEQELHPLYDKHETCLMCKNEFVSKKVRTRFLRIEDVESDFCPIYKDEAVSPLLYFNKVCPECGFTFNEQFSPYFPPNTEEEIKHNISEKWVPHDFSGERTYHQAIQTYKLAIYSGQLKNERAIVMAGLELRIAWLYRKMGNETKENRFLKFALSTLDEAYTESNYTNTDMNDVRVLYLIGELHRRFNDPQKAVYYYSKVVERQGQTLEHKVIERAREQWHIAREEYKQALNKE